MTDYSGAQSPMPQEGSQMVGTSDSAMSTAKRSQP